MKSTLKFASTTALSLVLAATAAFAREPRPNMPTPAPSQIEKSPAEVQSPMIHACCPVDHQKLASYFRAEAQKETAKAQYHEEMAKLSVSSSNDKHDMLGHCKRFAEEARKAAATDSQLAAEHEKMAETAK
jgi:hypothetical protein